jgi:hypothetical protein
VCPCFVPIINLTNHVLIDYIINITVCQLSECLPCLVTEQPSTGLLGCPRDPTTLSKNPLPSTHPRTHPMGTRVCDAGLAARA